MKSLSAMTCAAFAVLLTGCAAQTLVQRPPFPVAEYEKLVLDGTGTVSGQVFMKTVGGDVKYGAGSEVILFPVTSYSNFWYLHDYIEAKPLTPSDVRQGEYIKTTQADGNGNFKFTNVGPGNYYVSSSVTWQVPTQYGLSAQGGIVAKSTSVKADAESRVMLTK